MFKNNAQFGIINIQFDKVSVGALRSLNIVRFFQRGIGEFKLTTHLKSFKTNKQNTKDRGFQSLRI